jgi:hypothetical protein
LVEKGTHVFLPEGLISDFDQLFGKGKRSAFLTEIVEREVRRQKLTSALDDAAECWKSEDHPELEKAQRRLSRRCVPDRKPAWRKTVNGAVPSRHHVRHRCG